jgi:protein-S-isoprenylcysteine O-methyltransferase Ste14
LIDLLYSITTGSERRRRLLTPIVAALAVSLLLSVLVASRFADRALDLPVLLPGATGAGLGTVLLAAGLAVWSWSIALFNGKGVPVNPPRTLVRRGPYKWIRNPMLVGIWLALLGLGFLLHSAALVCAGAPAVILVTVIELKLVEEPELERRLGAPYRQYKADVPMFLPRWPASRHRGDRH